GIRPATESRDYQVRLDGESQYLCVGGIRSTGLSAALGIARLASKMIFGNQSLSRAPESIHWPTVPQISETAERDWMRPDNGGIVCHCELVTRREIEKALRGPLPARSLSGLKRRTRVMMGRCQGFYCSAELSEITAGYFDSPLDITDQ
ncbi:(2Fe-2S)-binding protein, partial [Candidatus Poribacteria bacterium]|nr:(2Fe-2S)-binding protein [Candidatus Poribacteria bacterium]